MAFEPSVEGGWQEYDVVGVYVGVDDLFVGFLACGQQAGAQVSTPGDGSSAACGFHVFDPEAFAGSLADSRACGGIVTNQFGMLVDDGDVNAAPP